MGTIRGKMPYLIVNLVSNISDAPNPRLPGSTVRLQDVLECDLSSKSKYGSFYGRKSVYNVGSHGCAEDRGPESPRLLGS